MKNCPFCAEQIQDAAVVCKHCGREVNKPLRDSNTEPPQKIEVVQKSSGLVTVLIVLAIVALLAFLFGF